MNNCKTCNDPDTADMVICQYCFLKFHRKCVGIAELDMASAPYTCATCLENPRQIEAEENNKNFEPALRKTREALEAEIEGLKRMKELLVLRNELLTEVQTLKADEPTTSVATVSQNMNLVAGTSNVYSFPPSTTTALPMNSFSWTRLAQDSVPVYTMSERTAYTNASLAASSGGFTFPAATSGNLMITTQSTATRPSISVDHQMNMPQVNSVNPYAQPFTPFQQVTPTREDFPYPTLLQNRERLALTHEQIQARKVTSRELPKFSGSLRQWPIFLSSYMTTTLTCNFDDMENLIRLQQLLSGEAKSSVEGMLTLPANVPFIIRRLWSLYGQANDLIKELLAEIMKLPQPSMRNPTTILKFGTQVHNMYVTMKTAGLVNHLNDPLMLDRLKERLHVELQMQWEVTARQIVLPNLEHFDSWIDNLAMVASRVTSTSFSSDKPKSQNVPTSRVNVHNEKKDPKLCPGCQGSCKLLENCDTFIRLPRNKKWEIAKESRLCFRCLVKHGDKCPEKSTCGVDKCDKRHHKLLHNHINGDKSAAGTSKTDNTREKPTPSSGVQVHMSHYSTTPNTLFRIMPVVLKNGPIEISTFAFMDEGSSVSLMDNSLYKALNLTGKEIPMCLKWSTDTVRNVSDSKTVSFSIRGSSSTTFKIDNVRTIDGFDLPCQSLNVGEMVKQYPYLSKYKIESYENAKPLLLIGLDNLHLTGVRKLKLGKPNGPAAVSSALGWTICGSYNVKKAFQSNTQSLNLHLCVCNNDELHKLIRDSFEIDNMGATRQFETCMSTEERRALQILESSTNRIGDKFETGLLWARDEIKFPRSRNMAMQRLLCNEKMLQRHPDLALKAIEIMREEESLGYVRKLSDEEALIEGDRTWYLPLFAVRNPNKPKKIRMVSDGDANVDGISLNSMLLKGPDLVPPLPQVILRYQERKICVSGDLKHMFHRIQVNEKDQDSQRFLWRESPQDAVSTFVFQVLTFGSKSSPSSAQFVKNRNAEEFKDLFPQEVKAIIENTYVDDYMDSFDTVNDAISKTENIRHIHSKANFELCQFRSNSNEVVVALLNETANSKNLDVDDNTTKALGLWHDLNSDCFFYSLQYSRVNKDILNGERIPTKREVLRTLMSIFDPNGRIAHFVVHLRILMQGLWRSGSNWDEQIPIELRSIWENWIGRLHELEQLRIPRCHLKLINNYENANIQMHVFCDAGAEAYCAVVYLRIQKNSLVDVAQLGSKVKVAPVKLTSIPRLELEAALIACRYSRFLENCSSIRIHERHFWTDSTTVLSWIRPSNRRYKQYVAFRVSEIQESTDVQNWHWISTKQNVADEPTKSSNNPSLDADSRWFRGPQFLHQPPNEWPLKNIEEIPVADAEVRPQLCHEIVPNLLEFTRFSSWWKLQRVVVYVCRIRDDFKARKPIKYWDWNVYLHSHELQEAEMILFKIAQRSVFSEDLSKLKNGYSLGKKSRLYRLSPYFDENDVLRLESRIDSVIVSFETRRPIIMPREHYTTQLLVKSYHVKYLHQHHETVINEIRKRFYIPQLRCLVKKISFECQHCRNNRAKPQIPRMAALPEGRLAAFEPPFTHSGVDFFGPLSAVVGRSIQKRYGVLFTCLTFRAIHIEVAHSLTISSCIMAIRNFMSRYNVRRFYSDNGTNFVGTERVLKEELIKLNTNLLAKEFTSVTIEWRFNPPAAPHMGGAWERLVRSVKVALYASLPSRTPNDEVLYNSLKEVENIVNSRPLVYVPIDSPQSEAITPKHFINLSSGANEILSEPCERTASLKNDFRLAQLISNNFSKRWMNEYLPELTLRSKWYEEAEPPKIGDVVIIVDPSHPRYCWPKGIVIDVKKAPDGRVRQCVVKTSLGVYTRPVAKIAVLKVDSCEDWTGGRNVQNSRSNSSTEN